MITFQSLSDKTTDYYAVYKPPHDGVPHLIVPVKVNFTGMHKFSYKGDLCISVATTTRSTHYYCSIEDNPFYKEGTMQPTRLLKLTAHQCTWLPQGTLYVTEDKQLLTKYIRDFYRVECHKGRITARGMYQKVMNTLKQLK